MLRHLGSVQAILACTTAATSATGAADAEVVGLVGRAEDSVMHFYGSLGTGELALLRQTLARSRLLHIEGGAPPT